MPTTDTERDDLDHFRRSSLSVRQEEERRAEVASLRTALRNLCLAVEDLLEDEKTCDLQDQYEATRAALGNTVLPLLVYWLGCRILQRDRGDPR